jgi:hypothetical protein
MNALTPAVREKLVRVLGMLGSDHHGERASAALHASMILKDVGLRWQDVIGSQIPQRQLPDSTIPTWRGDLALCARCVSYTREWERGFIRSVGARATLTPKQKLVLHEIAEALRARGLT